MKTTLDLPDPLFRRAKARAAERGETLREYVAEALRARLAVDAAPGGVPPWMAGFGKLEGLRKETARIQERVDAAFGQVEAEDRL